MERHIVTEEVKQQMKEMRQGGMSCRQVAQLLGVSKSTVSLYTGKHGVTREEKQSKLQRCCITTKKRKGVLYEVRIYFVRKHPDLEICCTLDHRPTYTDMMAICREYDLPAVDFADDCGTKMDARIYHGTVFTQRSRAFPLARFTIRRLHGDVRLEDFFR